MSQELEKPVEIFTDKVEYTECPHCDQKLDVSALDSFVSVECPACGKPFRVPGKLGTFVLTDELGRGAMGAVYLARDLRLSRNVALKVMQKKFGDDPKTLEVLEREAKAMAALNHPNVVQIYSFGRHEGQPYMVME